jgi:hypothetical protein
MYMSYDGVDGEVVHGRDASFATGHTLVHVEAAGGGYNEMSLDDTAGREDVEVMVKVLVTPAQRTAGAHGGGPGLAVVKASVAFRTRHP